MRKLLMVAHPRKCLCRLRHGIEDLVHIMDSFSLGRFSEARNTFIARDLKIATSGYYASGKPDFNL